VDICGLIHADSVLPRLILALFWWAWLFQPRLFFFFSFLQNSSKTLLKEKERNSKEKKSLPEKQWAPPDGVKH
jgi:hypothetical protein